MSELERLRIFVKKELEDALEEHPCDDYDTVVKATKLSTYEFILDRINEIQKDTSRPKEVTCNA